MAGTKIKSQETPLILIADDDEHARLILQKFLIRDGYKVAVAENGTQALELFQKWHPDIVLLDGAMPYMTGFDVCQTIKKLPDGERVPVLLLTAFDDDGAVNRAFEAGATDYIAKPIRWLILRHRLRYLTQLWKTEKDRQAGEELLQTIVGGSSIIVFSINKAGIVTLSEGQGLEATGFSPRDLVGQSVYERYGDKPEFLAAIQKAMAGAIVTETILFGDQVFQAHFTPIHNRDKAISGVSAVCTNITARKKAEEALRHYAQELEHRNQELDSYGFTIAHDLKNPLSLVLGYTALLQSDYAPTMQEEGQEFLERIKETAVKMQEMIEQLLYLSQLGNVQEAIEPVNMAEAAQLAASRFEDLFEKRQINFTIAEKLPRAAGQSLWIEEVFANLIGNAIKYMPPDTQKPTIQVRGRFLESAPDAPSRAGDNGHKTKLIRYEVIDNGRGIPAEKQVHLFEMFTRAHTGAEEGFGLGLAIVHRIITRLNGTVGVESTPGKGSTFWFTLPSIPRSYTPPKKSTAPLVAS